MPGSKGSGRPSETRQLKLHGEQGLPVLPADMTGVHAVELWELAITSLPNVLVKLDFAVLRLCCESYQLAMDCLADPKQRKLATSAMSRFESLARQIGLTPHSRRIIKPVDVETVDENDPYNDWLNRGGLG